MKFFRPKNRKAGFTLVEIMIVVLIIGILLAIAIPNFVSARESARAKSCVGNLKQIDSATQQYCMDKKLNAANYAASTPTLDTVAATGLVGTTGYIRSAPLCPSGGAYIVAVAITYIVAVAITGNPQCSTSGDGSAAANADVNYQKVAGVPGKFYHGL